MSGLFLSPSHNLNLTLFSSALGVQSLGNEVLGSLHALYGTKHTYQLAKAHQLLPDSDEVEFRLKVLTLSRGPKDDKPNILASRIDKLERLLRYRNSFHQRLKRDISRNMREQPFLFWGSLFAVIVGICTLIQTVTSVWGLCLAIQAARQG
ncbi:hypothetical protein BT69DRAFT_1302219 [Atractiella rhizophila]|nr:hypothetical protein BT69DRAFT_1302219 [Atractiella rhizophila]